MRLPLVNTYSIYLFFSFSLRSCFTALQNFEKLTLADRYLVIVFLFLHNGSSLVV